MPTVLITYDISADTTRARTAAHLQIWGDRIQRSVFICTLDQQQLTELTTRLHERIDNRTDAIHFVPICAACWDGIIAVGQATVEPNRLYWAVP